MLCAVPASAVADDLIAVVAGSTTDAALVAVVRDGFPMMAIANLMMEKMMRFLIPRPMPVLAV